MRNFLLPLLLWGACLTSVWGQATYQEFLRHPDLPEAQRLLRKLQASAKAGNLDGGVESMLRLLGSSRTLRHLALHHLIALRCERYLSVRDGYACGEAVWRMLKALDFDVRFLDRSPPRSRRGEWKPPMFVFVAFKQELMQRLAAPQSGVFLRGLTRPEGGELSPTPNLWERARSHFGSDPAAVGALATLFQDTSPAQSHLEFLARQDGQPQVGPYFHDNLGQLGQALELFSKWRDEDPRAFRAFAYPRGLGARFNGNIYHFYVPWHLAGQLRQQGLQPRWAAMAPFLLVATYEFVTAKADYSYLFDDPPLVTDTWKAQDISAGLMGSLRGAQGDFPRSRADVGALFALGTPAAMKELLQSL